MNSISEKLDIKTIELKMQEHFSQRFIDQIELNYWLHPDNMHFKAYFPPNMNGLIMSLIHHYYGYEQERMEVKYPRDWWQAFKERWYPTEWLGMWPVKYTHRVIIREVMFPELSTLKKDHIIKIFLREISPFKY